jgi:hemerythrin superfamily protein
VNALQLLRQMHVETKIRFKVILGSDDAGSAALQWRALQPDLELHERLEDEFVYTPLFEEMGVGTQLGDWYVQHEADIAIVKQLIQAADKVDPATPEWRMAIAQVMDTLSKHVTDEEGQIFGRVEQLWGTERLVKAGAQMQELRDRATGTHSRAATRVKPAKAHVTDKAAPVRRGRRGH